MRLPTLREALLDDARRQAADSVAQAEREADARVADARSTVDRLTADASRAGREEAARAVRRRESEGRRRARERVLRARREAYDHLRERAAEMIRLLPADERRALAQRLERLARTQLGDDAEIDADPDGGLVARAGSRSVDYRVPAIVARAITDLGDDVEELWR